MSKKLDAPNIKCVKLMKWTNKLLFKNIVL